MTIRVFEDQTGFFFCSDAGELETTQTPFPDARQATEEAIRWGELITSFNDETVSLIGSGVDRGVASANGINVLD